MAIALHITIYIDGQDRLSIKFEVQQMEPLI